MATEDLTDAPESHEEAETREPIVPVEPPRSRFLFVDVAALRAKQLRRGALPRLGADEAHHAVKAERVAMEEVSKGLVSFDLPEWHPNVLLE